MRILLFKNYFSGPNFIPTSDSKPTVYQKPQYLYLVDTVLSQNGHHTDI